MAFSVGEIWAIGFYCHTVSFHSLSSPRSTFPTINFFLCFPVRIVGGFFLSSQRYDSLFSHLLEINYRGKPPWILTYIHHSPVSLFFPVSVSYRHKSVSLMGESVSDSTLGLVDAPITLSPVIESSAASTNRFNLVVMKVNSRQPHLSDLIGPRLWILGLADDCVGQFLNPGMFRLRFRNEESLNWFLLRASWPLSDWMLTIHWWFPNIIEEASTIITLWTRIHGTLILYLINDMVKFAGFEIGLIITVDFEATVHSTGFVSVQMLWTYDKELLLKQKSKYFLALMEFTIFGRLANVLVTLRWILLVIRGLGVWDDMVDLFVATFKRITQAQFFKETVVRKCWCHYVYIPELAWDTSALMLHFVKGGHSQKLLLTIRNKEKSNM